MRHILLCSEKLTCSVVISDNYLMKRNWLFFTAACCFNNSYQSFFETPTVYFSMSNNFVNCCQPFTKRLKNVFPAFQ